MKVSTTQPFQILYSIFHHEYLGYLFQSFVVQINTKGELTLQHQTIVPQNTDEFLDKLDAVDIQLIELIESIQQDSLIKKFTKKKSTPEEFFLKWYNKTVKIGDVESKTRMIDEHLEKGRSKILELIKVHRKKLYIMAKDGNPIGKKINIAEEPATVLFHFRRNEDNTHYFPTIKYKGERLDFMYKNAFLPCKEPAWMVLENTAYYFTKEVDGNKLKPFLNKKFIEIPRKLEKDYYKKFIAPLIASFDVYAKGFEIKTEKNIPQATLGFMEYFINKESLHLFEDQSKNESEEENSKILFEISFQYGRFHIKPDKRQAVIVHLEEDEEENYTFYRVRRNLEFEKKIMDLLRKSGLELKDGKVLFTKGVAFSWLNAHLDLLSENEIKVNQNIQNEKKYFLGRANIDIEIKENADYDWFDIYTKVVFGEFEISFLELRKLILQKKREFSLPNGEIAVIPDAWFEKYTELFSFSDNKEGDGFHLKKYHLNLLNELQEGEYAKIRMSRKLEKFKEFEEIEDVDMPVGFQGVLRPYQKAGYNWLQFLNQYHFGGCLADDMGLGKTIMTLAFLQAQKEQGRQAPTLLLVPTSLIYNWQLEVKKFTPQLNVFIYAGTNRNKNTEYFDGYDLIIASYGVVRMDIEIMEKVYFNYIILDESQVIKNPTSNISQAVRKLKSKNRLILTGTPLENSTLDLWSQISFVNQGLLGTQSFFKNEYQIPIEKHSDADKLKKLSNIIKPFMLRRHKSQVATELPDKVENIHYCTMSDEQSEYYEKVKSQYRNEILELIENQGINKSQIIILQGLTKLRQIANHPRMINPDYEGNAAKFEDVIYKLQNILGENYKVLIFSQFVKHLTLFREYFDKQKWEYAYLDGSTRDRQEEVNKFQNDEKTKIFLISMKAGGTGLNLTAAEYVFLLDPWWNPAVEAQAVDRAHRIGQKNTVFTYKFISKDTIEEKILLLQKNKQKLANDLITTEETFVKSLSKEDVLSLLD